MAEFERSRFARFRFNKVHLLIHFVDTIREPVLCHASTTHFALFPVGVTN
jgi:hypothetical protein